MEIRVWLALEMPAQRNENCFETVLFYFISLCGQFNTINWLVGAFALDHCVNTVLKKTDCQSLTMT